MSVTIESSEGCSCSYCHQWIRRGERVAVVKGYPFSKRYHMECLGAVR
jgi:hypothetical protein